ncbi:MAG: DUF2383 domain-containing protein [Pseudomonadota bacterium]
MFIATTAPVDTYATVPDQPREALNDLSTVLADTIEGYAVMTDKAEPTVQPVVRRFLALHQTHAARLRELCAEQGGDPEDAGSVMGAVHKAMAHTRDALGRLDERAEDTILRIEARVMERYRNALDALEGHPVIQSVIAVQHLTLREHVAALKY